MGESAAENDPVTKPERATAPEDKGPTEWAEGRHGVGPW